MGKRRKRVRMRFPVLCKGTSCKQSFVTELHFYLIGGNEN
jgi:hypothetical protein